MLAIFFLIVTGAVLAGILFIIFGFGMGKLRESERDFLGFVFFVLLVALFFLVGGAKDFLK